MATPATNLCPCSTPGNIALGKCCFNGDHEISNDGQSGDLGGLCLEYDDSIPIFWGGGSGCVRDYLGQFLPGGRRGQCLHPSGLSRALLRTELTSALVIWLSCLQYPNISSKTCSAGKRQLMPSFLIQGHFWLSQASKSLSSFGTGRGNALLHHLSMHMFSLAS